METGASADQLHAEAPLPRAGRVGGLRSAAEVRAAVVTAVILTALGAGEGRLWAAVSPRVHVVVTAAGPDLSGFGGGDFFAVDATFALIGAVAGVLLALAAWRLARRWRGPLLLVGLVVGGLLCGFVAWQVGRRLGLSHYRQLLRSADVGRQFDKPVDLRSTVALVAQPLFSAAAYLFLAILVSRPDLGSDRR